MFRSLWVPSSRLSPSAIFSANPLRRDLSNFLFQPTGWTGKMEHDLALLEHESISVAAEY